MSIVGAVLLPTIYLTVGTRKGLQLHVFNQLNTTSLIVVGIKARQSTSEQIVI